MNIIFMGTPDFAIPSLSMLIASDNNVMGVVTQPDRPRGRSRKPQPPPVKTLALQHGLPLLQPDRLKEDNFIQWLKSQSPDLVVVVAYGQMLPPKILILPRAGCINLHASLLPSYRGAAPINRVLMKGEKRTGVTTLLMNEWMDAGDLFLKRETRIEPEEDAITLSQRLSTLGAKLLLETIRQIKKGSLTPIPQDHSKASYAPALKKEDGRIDWDHDAHTIHNQIRGTLPWPGAFTHLNNKVLKIFKSELVACPSQDSPGRITQINSDGIHVATGRGCLLLTDIQLQDRKRLKVSDFIKGNRIPTGTLLT